MKVELKYKSGSLWLDNKTLVGYTVKPAGESDYISANLDISCCNYNFDKNVLELTIEEEYIYQSLPFVYSGKIYLIVNGKTVFNTNRTVTNNQKIQHIVEIPCDMLGGVSSIVCETKNWFDSNPRDYGWEQYMTEYYTKPIANSRFRIGGIWKTAFTWIKTILGWKRCIIWRKINGIWKRGK